MFFVLYCLSAEITISNHSYYPFALPASQFGVFIPGRKEIELPFYLYAVLLSHYFDYTVTSLITQSLPCLLGHFLDTQSLLRYSVTSFTTMAKPSPALEKAIDDKIMVAKLDVLAVEKRDWLDNQCKQYENNLKISGLQHVIKDYYGKNAQGRREWRAEIIQRAFVDTNIVDEDVLFAKNANGKKELKRVVRDVHPLGNRDNATIVCAFTESWVANDIKETVRKGGSHLQMTKQKRNKAPEVIKINSHLPAILESLRNEALKARRTLIAAANAQKRYICNESLKFPWILIYEIEGEVKRPIPFAIEDGRLADPARSLAVYSLEGGEFKPYRMLTPDEKKNIPTNVMTTVPPEKMT